MTGRLPARPLRRWFLGARPARTALRAGVLVAGGALVFGVVLRPVRAHGVSMWPTISDGDLVFVNTLAYRGGATPRRGDIVAIRLAGPRVVYVKRVVGLPGERLRLVDGALEIDGRPIDEPYVRARQPWQVTEVRLGTDEYFVVGDNRGMPQHLHDFGRVARSRILGRVVRW